MHVQGAGQGRGDRRRTCWSRCSASATRTRCPPRGRGITRLDVVNYISHGISKLRRRRPRPRRRAAPTRRRRRGRGGAGQEPARRLRVNLNERARAGRDRSADRPRTELERTIQVLAGAARTTRCSSATPGVGKTAIVEGLALRIEKGEVPGGARGRDDLRARHGRAARRHAVPRRLRGAPQGGDRGARGAGRTRSSSSTRSTRSSAPARPAAARWTRRTCSSRRSSSGELRCIGATTFQEYRSYFERDRALARRFQQIEVERAVVAETIKILRGLRAALRGVPRRHVHRRGARGGGRAVGALPARPQAARQGDRSDRRGGRRSSSGCRRPRTEPAAEVGARQRHRGGRRARWRRSRRERVAADEREQLQRPRGRRSSGAIFGQDEAVEQRRAGDQAVPRRACARRNKPIGSFLFAGPTGVGKTELAKQLAKIARRRVPALRHERVHGAAHGLAPDRRAARLRRLRPGRPADRRDRQDTRTRCCCSTRSRRRTRTCSTSCSR